MVVSSVLNHHPSLAIGNVIGSCIANILGAFSLGLILLPSSSDKLIFDRSSKLWSLVQFFITTISLPLYYLWKSSFEGSWNHKLGKVRREQEREKLRRFIAFALLVIFLFYLLSVFWAISRGRLDAPEHSDSDSDSNGEEEESDEEESEGSDSEDIRESQSQEETNRNINESTSLLPPERPRSTTNTSSNTSASLPTFSDRPANRSSSRNVNRRRKSFISSQILPLIISTLALSLSGFLLSHSISSLTDTLSISNTVLGLTILSFITTLPEKFLSALSGFQGKSGILLASTAGSNIFLLTLCGSVSLGRQWKEDEDGFGSLIENQVTIKVEELFILWLSSLALVVVTLRGGKSWHGWVLMLGYILFLAAELSVWKR